MSGLLLDSNALVWWLDGATGRGAEAVDRVRGEANVMVSVVSPWELWIKSAAGKLQLPVRFDERLKLEPIDLISPTIEDARLAADLPPLHRDPFDRMIIAQALNRRATVITSDRVFANYGVQVVLI